MSKINFYANVYHMHLPDREPKIWYEACIRSVPHVVGELGDNVPAAGARLGKVLEGVEMTIDDIALKSDPKGGAIYKRLSKDELATLKFYARCRTDVKPDNEGIEFDINDPALDFDADDFT